MTLKSVLTMLLALALGAPLAVAKVTEEEAARLGKDLTPLGAVAAGEGDVPAWTGGLTGVPEGIKFDPKKQHPPNPFADDQIKYTITRKNMAQYDALLTDGHKAMLKRVPGFVMNVYQSRRSCTVPQFVQQATRRNATSAALSADGEGITGVDFADAYGGLPFPIPKSGKELMWNHRLRYVPDKMTRQHASVVVDGGARVTYLSQDKAMREWPFLGKPDAAPTIRLLLMRDVISPARVAGSVLLVVDELGEAAIPRVAWLYSPSARRVRRFPDYAYDGPAFIPTGGLNADRSQATFVLPGMLTADTDGGFNGALDRYEWTLGSRKVMLVPYNSYALTKPKYEQLVGDRHLNPDFVRYEPHRVWPVEAKLLPGQTHLYSRRVLYLDEDSYTIVAGELYDGRGRLTRVQEQHTANFWRYPACLPVAETMYDVRRKGAFVVSSLISEEPPLAVNANESVCAILFAPEQIRTTGWSTDEQKCASRSR